MLRIVLLCWAFLLVSACSTYAQNAPVTILPVISECPGISSVDVPVRVTSFNNIGALSLTMHYDSSVISYQSFVNTSGFPGLEIYCPVPGTLIAGGFVSSGTTGLSLSDSSILFTASFEYLGGSTALSWYDNGTSCEYAGPPPGLPTLNDSPQDSFYMDGSVTELPLPASPGTIAGPAGNYVCRGQTGVAFSVSPVQNASGYSWTVPSGAAVISGSNTNSILVDFSNSAISGDVSVYGTNACGNGSSSASFIDVYASPGPAGGVYGPGSVCQSQSGVIFSVNPIANATGYAWSLPTGAIITGGANTNIITVTFTGIANSGNVTVYGTNSCDNGAISPVFPLTVNEIPLILVQPASPEPVMAGAGTAAFAIVASATGINYQWQEFASSWSDITDGGMYEGETTPTLTITDPPFLMNGYRYRCLVSGTCEPPAFSDGNATLTVLEVVGIEEAGNEYHNKPESITAQPALTIDPNPFRNNATIYYFLPEDGQVSVVIMNMLGEKVQTVCSQSESAGEYNLELSSGKMKAGAYIINLIVRTDNNILRKSVKVYHLQ